MQAHLVGPEGDGLLVEVVPGAPELPRLVPDLLQERVVLHDDGVLDERALRGGRGVAVVDGGHHPAAAKGDVERGLNYRENKRENK